MAKFNGYVLTEKGRELLAKGLAGERITFTKMQIGDGTATTDARNMTALVSPKKDLTLLNINVTGGQCELTALLSNHELRTGFYIRELGVFARGNDDTEILYAYNVSPNPDFIPPFNANNIVEIEYVDTLIIDRVANVTAVIDPSITYITKQMADTLYLEKKRLNEIMGLEFGGNIQDIGTKTVGKFYYDTSTKHYFECIANNNLTYVDVTKFKPISNKPISDKLENLYSFRQEEVRLNSANGLTQQIFNLISVGSLRIISFSNLGVKNEYETKFVNIPDWFCKNAVTLNFSAANGTGGAGGEVAECYFNATERSLSIYPSIRNGHVGNLQMTGQGVTVARI